LREGILLTGFTSGKVFNNVVARAGTHGIVLDSTSSDSLVRDNVVTGSGFHTSIGGDGLRIEGDRITIEENTLNANLGAGLRLTSTSSALTFGRNTARGNTGVGSGPCAASPPLFPPNSCNDGSANNTFGNNLIPGPSLF
jgi:parallel beta-helix repeat protein